MTAVKSVNHFTVAMTTGNLANTASVSGVTLAKCVPFTTVRVDTASTSLPEEPRHYVVDSWLTTGPDTLHVSRDFQATSSAVTAEVYLVEFDACTVESGTFTMSGDDTGAQSVNQAITAVVLADSFVYFTYFENGGSRLCPSYAIRAELTTTTQITFDREESGGTVDGHWYVVSSTDSSFSVAKSDVTIADTSSSNTDTVSVTAANTLMLGSYKVDTIVSSFDNDDNNARASLDSGTTVTVERAGTTGALTFHGQLIKFTDGTTIERGTRTQATSIAQDDITVSLSDFTNCLPILAGQMGNSFGGGTFSGTSAADVTDSFISLLLTSNTNLRIEKDTAGGESGHDISWEVAEFGGGGAVARRVMVVS